jgi:hypothetical protein
MRRIFSGSGIEIFQSFVHNVHLPVRMRSQWCQNGSRVQMSVEESGTAYVSVAGRSGGYLAGIKKKIYLGREDFGVTRVEVSWSRTPPKHPPYLERHEKLATSRARGCPDHQIMAKVGETHKKRCASNATWSGSVASSNPVLILEGPTLHGASPTLAREQLRDTWCPKFFLGGFPFLIAVIRLPGPSVIQHVYAE